MNPLFYYIEADPPNQPLNNEIGEMDEIGEVGKIGGYIYIIAATST